MAIGGAKAKPAELKVITGNPGKREILKESEIAVREDDLVPMKKLTKAQQKLWDRFVNTAWWLTDHDVPKAYKWTCLMTEYVKAPAKMVAARITQLRVLGSELGFDPGERARMGISNRKNAKSKDPTEKFFD